MKINSNIIDLSIDSPRSNCLWFNYALLKNSEKKTNVKIYSPCPGCPSFPPCDWCCRPCSCWRCCWSPPGHSCRRPARRSPSLSASCLSNMRCTGDRSCRIAHVPETGVRLAFWTNHDGDICLASYCDVHFSGNNSKLNMYKIAKS